LSELWLYGEQGQVSKDDDLYARNPRLKYGFDLYHYATIFWEILVAQIYGESTAEKQWTRIYYLADEIYRIDGYDSCNKSGDYRLILGKS
jgi:hypothetical protein